MAGFRDGPCSSLFTPLPFQGNTRLEDLPVQDVSPEMAKVAIQAPRGTCVCWGIPFEVDQVIVLNGPVLAVEIAPVMARWLVFMHTSDLRPDRCI